jgi:Fe-S-cluster containining protein
LSDGLTRSWLHAARDPAVAGELNAIYGRAAEAIARRGPACWASGRCCNFEKHGHRLYVTGLEAAATALFAASRPVPALGAGDGPARVSLTQLESARASGGCPYQGGNLCGVHEGKPLGCRVYFCDRSSQVWQQELSEELLGAIRELHDHHGVAYRYGEWRAMLATVLFELSSEA